MAEAFAAVAGGLAAEEVAESLAAALAIDVRIALMLLRLLTSNNYVEALLPDDTQPGSTLAGARAQQGEARRQYLRDAVERARSAPTREEWSQNEQQRYAKHVVAQERRRDAARQAERVARESRNNLVEWRSHRDSATCKSCWDLHGRRLSLNDPGSWPIGKQGYGVLPGANHPQCRCSAHPIRDIAELAIKGTGTGNEKDARPKSGGKKSASRERFLKQVRLTADALLYESRGDWEKFVNEVALDEPTKRKLLKAPTEDRWEIARRIKEIFREEGYELSNSEVDTEKGNGSPETPATDDWQATHQAWRNSLE